MSVSVGQTGWSVYERDPVHPLLAVAVMVKELLDVLLEVPVMAPVLGFKDAHVGSAPAVTA